MQLGQKELLEVFTHLDEELDGCPYSEILVAGGAAIEENVATSGI